MLYEYDIMYWIATKSYINQRIPKGSTFLFIFNGGTVLENTSSNVICFYLFSSSGISSQFSDDLVFLIDFMIPKSKLSEKSVFNWPFGKAKSLNETANVYLSHPLLILAF